MKTIEKLTETFKKDLDRQYHLMSMEDEIPGHKMMKMSKKDIVNEYVHLHNESMKEIKELRETIAVMRRTLSCRSNPKINYHPF